MAQEIATIGMSEVKANFSKVANRCHETKTPITVFKHNKPWVNITPVNIEGGSVAVLSLEDQMQLAMQQVDEGKVSSMSEFLETL